jgi:transposase
MADRRGSKVVLFEQIRRARRLDPDVSVRALSRRFNVHRRTVREALSSAVPTPRKQPARPSPVMGRWGPVIDEWLVADRDAPRKQRHTARRIWERLVAEHDAQVAESTVREYVRGARPRLGLAEAEVMVPQVHPLGAEAEVDWGDVSFVLGGVSTVGSLFVMRLSASAKTFRRVYLSEGQEVFLDAHVRAFEFFGGVPERVRYDNLKTAVVKVLRGRDRAENDRFVALRSHYGFDSFFCRPGIDGAHEKGGVEGEIGRWRRKAFVPVPDVATVAELNDRLDAISDVDDRRHVASRRVSVADHFELEAPELAALPGERFDTSLFLSCRVDPKVRVCVRQSWYSVPARYAGRRLDVRLSAEHVEVFDAHRVVALHPRLAVRGGESLILDHYLEVLVRKPGALPNATALARARASGVFTATHQRFWDVARQRLGDRDGTRALIEVLLLHRQLSAAAVEAGMCAALTVGTVDAAVVEIETRRHGEQRDAVVIPIGEHLTRFDRPTPSLDRYDTLLEA